MYNFNHLYYFYVTAKLGGVSKAAKFLRISQPSLSSQIKTLEGSLDLKLLKKAGRGIELTTDGSRTYAYCRTMFEAAEEMQNTLAQNTEVGALPKFRLGVSRDIERPFVVDVLSSLMKTSGNQQIPFVSMISGQHTSLVEELVTGTIDAVITEKPTYLSEVAVQLAVNLPVNLILSRRTAKKFEGTRTDRKEDVFKALKLVPGIALPTEGLRLRAEIDQFLHSAAVTPKLVFESDILSAVVRWVGEGLGASFLPTAYVHRELQSGALEALGPARGLWSHNIMLVVRRGRPPNDMITKLGAALATYQVKPAP